MQTQVGRNRIYRNQISAIQQNSDVKTTQV